MKSLGRFSLISFLSLWVAESVLACPACAGTLESPNDKYVLMALGIFILLAYIPFYFLWRVSHKNRNLSQMTHKTKNPPC